MNNFFVRYRVGLICVALAGATVIAFWQVKNCDFINFDDNVYVTENPNVKAGITLQSVRWALTEPLARNWHPLTCLSLMLDYQLFGLNPAAFHLTNLFWHSASAILLFLVLNSMTGRIWPSAFVAAAFALHPLHVESVAWVSERKDVLSGFFWILTMAAYVHYTRRPSLKRHLMVLAAFILGLLSKAMLVTLPFALLLFDYWPLGRLAFAGKNKRSGSADSSLIRRRSFAELVKEKIPLFIISLIFCLVTFFVQRQGGTMRSFDMFPLSVRLANALVSYTAYIWKMILPVSLAILYPHSGRDIFTWQPILSVIILAGLTAIVLTRSKSKPYLAVGWLFFLGTLLPVIGVIQVGAQAMADRYSYIPLIGVFIIIAWGAADASGKWRYRNTAITTAAAIVLVSWSVLTSVQVSRWKNSLTVFGHTLDVTRKNYTAHNNLAVALYDAGRIDEAVEHYQKALRISPSYIKARFNYGNALLRQDRREEAIVQWKQVVKLDPSNSDAYNNIGYALGYLGRFDEAVSNYRQAISIEPESLLFRENLSKILDMKQKFEKAFALYDAANILAKQGKLDEAVAQYEQALEVNPNFPDAHNNLANVCFLEGRFDDAVEHYKAALEIAPEFTETHYNLGVLLERQGKPDQAIAEYRETLRLKPAHSKAAAALQKLLDSLGDKK